MKSYTYSDCPICGIYGKNYWHHVFNASLKSFSEKYNAIIYICYKCHVTNKDSIHNNYLLRLRLKKEHQLRIMEEQGWTAERWFKEVGESYL